MLTNLLTAIFAITIVLGLYTSFGYMILTTKYFKKDMGKRVHLKLINHSIHNAPNPDARKRFIQLKNVYIVFLAFAYSSFLIFVINIIMINWK